MSTKKTDRRRETVGAFAFLAIPRVQQALDHVRPWARPARPWRAPRPAAPSIPSQGLSVVSPQRRPASETLPWPVRTFLNARSEAAMYPRITSVDKTEAEAEIHKREMATAELCAEEARRLCPVDTGFLRSRIEVVDLGADGAGVRDDAEYAPFVEFGTVKMAAQPFLRPAVLGTEVQVVWDV